MQGEVDPARKGLYKIGGAAMLSCGVLHYVGTILSLLLGPCPKQRSGIS